MKPQRQLAFCDPSYAGSNSLEGDHAGGDGANRMPD